MEFKAGDKVKYNDLNLREYVGTVTQIKRTANGGDCLVQWHKYQFVSEECQRNLTLAQ